LEPVLYLDEIHAAAGATRPDIWNALTVKRTE
jgi:hypothetical protein